MPAPTKPRLSVLLPIYNAGPYLDEALRSIAEQTFTDFEVLAIDDYSTDGSAETVRAWVVRDSRFRLLTNTGPNGLPNGLNLGLQEAQGELLARMDQDDISLPTRFAEQVAFLDRHPSVALVGASFQPFDATQTNFPVSHSSSSTMLAWLFLTNTRFGHPSVMFRRSIVDRVGPYPIQEAEDFGFFSKIVQAAPTTNLPTVLLRYREHGGNMSIVRREKISRGVQETYRRNFQHYTGAVSHLEDFYHFHAGRYLPWRAAWPVWRISWQILRRIRKDYRLPFFSADWLTTVLQVGNQLVRSIARATLRLPSLASKLSV